MVYLILDKGSHFTVKIGWSKKTSSRLKQLQTGHPNKLELVAVWDVPNYYEKRLHRALFSHKTTTSKEWFNCSDVVELTEVIGSISKSGATRS